MSFVSGCLCMRLNKIGSKQKIGLFHQQGVAEKEGGNTVASVFSYFVNMLHMRVCVYMCLPVFARAIDKLRYTKQPTTNTNIAKKRQSY